MWQDCGSQRLVLYGSLMIALVVLGTVGYALVEGWNWDDGFFMAVITMSTVGYGEPRPLTPIGRLFTAGLILGCIVTMTCWTAALTSFIIENDLSGHFVRRRMARMIDKLKDHTIICGSGQMAQVVIERLMAKRIPLVLVDDQKEQTDALKRRFRNLLVVEANATSELALAQANIDRARYVVAAMESEVDNLLIGITCKDMGHEIAVFARSNNPSIANRMRKAGIDEVISPLQLCGERVASCIAPTPAEAPVAMAT